MNRRDKTIAILFGLLILSLFLLGGCRTTPDVSIPTLQVDQPSPTPEPSATADRRPTPTVAESPAETPLPGDSPVEVPTVEPRQAMENEGDWSTFATTRILLSGGHPGDMIGQGQLPATDGYFVTDASMSEYGMVFALWPAADVAQKAAGWAENGTVAAVQGVMPATVDVVAEGDPVTISRLEGPTRVGRSDAMTYRAAFVPHPQGVLEVTWFAQTDRWESLQSTFDRMVSSVEIWRKLADARHGVQLVYPHDWPEPTVTLYGDGIWFRSSDAAMGLALWFRESGNPVEALASWSPERLTDLGLSNPGEPTAGERLSVLGGEWDSKTGSCEVVGGAGGAYTVTIVPNRDRLLEIVTYAPKGRSTWAETIFDTMRQLLADIR